MTQPNPHAAPQSPEGQYRIGVVSNLTGLPANTIRTWERRYDVVEPRRTDCGARLYSEDDITRLQLIRALCQHNENISALASLSVSQLRERLALHTSTSPQAQPQRLRVILGDHNLHTQLRANPLDSQPLDILLSAPTPQQLLALLTADLQPDALIVSLSWLGADPTGALLDLQALASPRLTLVLYDFATRDTLDAITALGARLLRAPVRAHALCQLLLDHLALPTPTAQPPAPPQPSHRRLSDEQLALLRERKTPLGCECPNHLASLASALVAFEEYSANCQDKNEDDARLHQVIHSQTSQARAILEDLILLVCHHENITL